MQCSIPNPATYAYCSTPIVAALLVIATIACSADLHAEQLTTASETTPAPQQAFDSTDQAGRELARYISIPDPSFGWKQIHAGQIGDVEYTELILTSQTWRGVIWKHQLYVLKPKKLRAPVQQGFIFIHGGKWKSDTESAQRATALPRQAHIFARLTTSLQAPVAVLRQVPFQPLFERTEDALIAHTFERYLKTGEADWPLLLPMVKSTARAMDAVQEHLREHWQIPLETFMVAGASKRGWTSWLTAAVDPRVTAVAPMVIDMLNLPAQIELQRATFGALSEQVREYADIGLPSYVDTAPGRRLLQIVDPYNYRDRLTPAKLILLGTNDRYWPLDALKLYWRDLPGPKNVLYVPNQGHGLKDVDRLINALSALHRYSARGESLPELRWKFTPGQKSLTLQVNAARKPRRVRAWTARSPTRDFRDARWTSHRCETSAGRHVCRQPLAQDQYTALYAEAEFKDRREPPFSLTTGVCILAVTAAERQCEMQNE